MELGWVGVISLYCSLKSQWPALAFLQKLADPAKTKQNVDNLHKDSYPPSDIRHRSFALRQVSLYQKATVLN